MDIEVIEVEVDDQAQTSALGALSDSAAAEALRIETKRAPSPRIPTGPVPRRSAPPPAPSAKLKADGTQEIELGDVLEVMQKMPTSKAAAALAPKVELAALPVTTPAPLNPNATAEIRPGDVLEEVLIDEPAPVVVSAQAARLSAPATTVTAPMSPPFPAPAASGSDLAATTIRPPTPSPTAHVNASASLPLPQFSPDEEVAPFASDTVDIPIDRVAGLPIWLQIKGKPGVAIVGGAIGACALIGILAIGMHFHSSSDEASASTSPATTTAAHATTTTAAAAAPNHEDPSAAIPPPPETPDVPSVSIDDLQKEGRAATASTAAAHPRAHASTVSRHVDAIAAPPAPHPRASSNANAKTAASSSKPQGFGTIRTWIAARGESIAVDGKVVGVAPTPVRVACGEHTVAIGKEIVHASVPCDGAVTVGSPGHQK